MSAFDRLISQIDSFIRKYYKNELIKGSLLFLAVFLITFLLVVSLEYFGHFNSFVRGILFFSFLISNGYILVKYFVIPLMKLKAYGKRIDRYQAAKIIGSFFPTVSDRLLNTLQLNDEIQQSNADLELLSASVQQRSEQMVSVPFSDAIDLKDNNKYVVWVLPIVLTFFTIYYFAPTLFTQGTKRVVQFTQDFPIIAPYEYNLNSDLSKVEEGSDVLVDLSLSGEEIPEQVFIHTEKGKFLMKRTGKTRFQYTVSQVRKDQQLYFTSLYSGYEISSDRYNVNVIGKSSIGKLDVNLVYPKYLGLENETLSNASDIVVPEGTLIEWSVLTKNSKPIIWKWDQGDSYVFEKQGFKTKIVAKENAKANVVLSNIFSNVKDTFEIDLTVIKDAHPFIDVKEEKDSINDGVRYFAGKIGDDHGLSSLKFHYTITRKNGDKQSKSFVVMPVGGLEHSFTYAVDFRREDVQLEDKIEYYFSVGDNDGVNGSKYTRSSVYTYQLPTLDELIEKRDQDQSELNDQLRKLMEQTDQFKKDLEKLKKESLNANSTSWKQQNQAEKLQEQHQSILEELSKTQEMMNKSLEEKNQLSEVDEDLLKKQEMINDLLDEIMDDELKDLLEKLEELLKEQNKDKLQDTFDDLEMNSEEMNRQLDRSMEMLKKMRVDEKIDDVEKALEELAKEQEELKKDIDDGKLSGEEAEKEQEELNKKFEGLKENIKDLDSLNKDLERPMELGDLDQRSEDIQEELEDAKENLSKGKEGKAGENQGKASDKMEQMAKDLDQAQQESNQQQQEEDINMLRAILESLLLLSVDQESVMLSMGRQREDDPAFISTGRKQQRIIRDTKSVADSLYALAKRQPKIATFIDEELNQIRTNQDLAIEDIDERRKRDLGIHQQYAMTSYNNLALMLNESLQQMQEQMQNSKPGSGSCNKPGGKGVPKPGEGMNPGNMKEMLKKQLEQMQKGDGGDKPGDSKKPGGPGGSGQLGSQGLAKMAAEQSAIRRRLEQLRKELNKDGSGNGNQLNPLIKELEKQEDEIINKRINREVINRQKDILTRLLESEKALMERGLDEKRESKEGKNEINSNKIEFQEYTKERLKQIELLRSVDPSYKMYYKDRANEYLNRVL
ncbi:MAG: hypothetical protein EP322_08690 [Bacteroidetes bacterium]|nr:MAG: hypothetical protein EP322_08690 [Bacteroidota bacterium]